MLKQDQLNEDQENTKWKCGFTVLADFERFGT